VNKYIYLQVGGINSNSENLDINIREKRANSTVVLSKTTFNKLKTSRSILPLLGTKAERMKMKMKDTGYLLFR